MLKRSLAVLAALTLLSLTACSDDGEDSDDGDTTAKDAAGVQCTYEPDGQQPAKDVEMPPSDASRSGKVEVEIETSFGDLNATLDADKTPCTVNSFLSLADQDYYDDTPCHRLTTQGIYVLQCGDPTGTGMGGPGYGFADELSGDETYPAGTLAMANAGPNTNGSQFFMVYDETPLDPAYTVFGQIDAAGVKLLEKVAAKGTVSGGPDDAPKGKVTIEEIDASDD